MRFTMLFTALFSVTAFLYAAMVFWTLPSIADGAGGLVPFDQRLTGYTYEEAHAFLTALTPGARQIYLGQQHLLDMLFPGALALTLCLIFNRISDGAGALIGMGLAIGSATADYFENMVITRLLVTEGAPLHVMVMQANQWTVLKTACSFGALILLIWLALSHFREQKRLRHTRV